MRQTNKTRKKNENGKSEHSCINQSLFCLVLTIFLHSWEFCWMAAHQSWIEEWISNEYESISMKRLNSFWTQKNQHKQTRSDFKRVRSISVNRLCIIRNERIHLFGLRNFCDANAQILNFTEFPPCSSLLLLLRLHLNPI